jgi:hypothetical protein
MWSGDDAISAAASSLAPSNGKGSPVPKLKGWIDRIGF